MKLQWEILDQTVVLGLMVPGFVYYWEHPVVILEIFHFLESEKIMEEGE
jgi:hypothetical protein